jgi:hypothetical protein
MGWYSRFVDWVDARVDRPADQTVLHDPRGGSERMIEAEEGQEAEAGSNVRRNRARMRHRWLRGGR